MLSAVLTLLLSVATQDLAAQPAVPSDYTIGSQDILRITVLGHDDLTQSVLVQGDGTISYPLVGRVKASDLTTSELEKKLVELLGSRYIREPQVTVTVQEYRSKSVFVVGEIARPGTYPLARVLSLVEILAKAGPLNAVAAAEVVIVRSPDGATGPLLPPEPGAGGDTRQLEVIRVNVRELEAGRLENNLLLRSGDTIFVPQAPKLFVSGEVRSPGAYPHQPGMTVRQAVSLAGGLTPDGSLGRTRVIRSVDGKSKESKIGIDELVLPGDTIVVRAKLF